MSKKLAYIGLAVIPFIVIAGQDIRELQFALAIGIALCCVLLAMRDGVGRVDNTPALLFMGYLYYATMLAPMPGVDLGGMSIGKFWAWRPLFNITVVFLFINAVSHFKLDKVDIKKIVNIISWAGVAMAGFLFLQMLGLDQFFVRHEASMPHNQWNLAGTIGHPSFVGTWLAMVVPFTLSYKNKWKFIVTTSAVILTMSLVAIGSLAVGLWVYWAIKSHQRAITALKWAIFTVFAIGCIWWTTDQIKYGDWDGHDIAITVRTHLSSSGRIQHWKLAVQDINKPLPGTNFKFPITGRGLGSFWYVFHTEHNNRFFQAHNEYLELAYNTGIAGLILFIWAIVTLLKPYRFGRLSRYERILVGSFTVGLVSAGALFIWQLGPHVYYCAFIAGLLNNKSV
jgi:hypothetical protein